MVSFNVSAMFKNTVDTQKIQDKVQRMKTKSLVGYPSGRAHIETYHNDDGTTSSGTETEMGEQIETSELAKQLYYGTATIPARPFLTDAIKKNKEEIADALKEEAKKEINGGSANWDKVGALAVGCIQEFVRGDYYRENIPNSPTTIKRKKSDKPLIDGGDLINATAYIVDGENN